MNPKALFHSSAVCMILAAAWTLDNVKPVQIFPSREGVESATTGEPTDQEVSATYYVAFMQASADCYQYQRCARVRQLVVELRERNVCVLATEPARIIPCPARMSEQEVAEILREDQ